MGLFFCLQVGCLLGEDSDVRYAEVYRVQKSYRGIKPKLLGNWLEYIACFNTLANTVKCCKLQIL